MTTLPPFPHFETKLEFLAQLAYKLDQFADPVVALCDTIKVNPRHVRLTNRIEVYTYQGWRSVCEKYSHLHLPETLFSAFRLQQFKGEATRLYMQEIANYFQTHGRPRSVIILHQGRPQTANVIAADLENFPHVLQVTATCWQNPMWIHPKIIFDLHL